MDLQAVKGDIRRSIEIANEIIGRNSNTDSERFDVVSGRHSNMMRIRGFEISSGTYRYDFNVVCKSDGVAVYGLPRQSPEEDPNLTSLIYEISSQLGAAFEASFDGERGSYTYDFLCEVEMPEED